jgi:hypothetical protein
MYNQQAELKFHFRLADVFYVHMIYKYPKFDAGAGGNKASII